MGIVSNLKLNKFKYSSLVFNVINSGFKLLIRLNLIKIFLGFLKEIY